MPFMVKDGFRLYYEDTGGNAPALLFLHGAGGNHLSWWQQVPVFAEEYRCVTVDQRGFGFNLRWERGCHRHDCAPEQIVDAGPGQWTRGRARRSTRADGRTV